jgi:hypothetical protein
LIIEHNGDISPEKMRSVIYSENKGQLAHQQRRVTEACKVVTSGMLKSVTALGDSLTGLHKLTGGAGGAQLIKRHISPTVTKYMEHPVEGKNFFLN